MNTIVALIFALLGAPVRKIDVLSFVYVDVVYVAIWAVIRRIIKHEREKD